MNFSRLFRLRLCHLPIFTSFWILLTFITSYLIAVKEDHVSPLLPYISATGALVPESCIFGQMLNISALLMMVTMYVRHKTIKIFKKDVGDDLERVSKWAFWLAILSSIGVSIVANFQETSQLVVHSIGATLAFGLGGVYCIIQTYIDRFCLIEKSVKVIRITLAGMIVPVFILSMIGGYFAQKEFRGKDMYHWKPSDGGYDLHLVATFSEWINAILLDLFLLSYVSEFKKVKLEEISFVEKYLL